MVWLVYLHEFGIEIASYHEDYRTTADLDAVSSLMLSGRESWERVPLGQERQGDVGLIYHGRVPGHAGIVARPGKLLHVKRGQASVIEDYRRPGARLRVEGFYRHRG